MVPVQSVLGGSLAAVLLIAAVGKLRSPRSFATTLRGLHLPAPAIAPCTALVIAMETLVCFSLALGTIPVTTAVCAVILFAVFSVVGLHAHRRGLAVSCGCFGPSATRLGLGTAGRSTGLMLAAGLYGALGMVGVQPVPAMTLALLTLIISVEFVVRWHVTTQPGATG